VDCVQWLVEQGGADCTLMDDSRFSALIAACQAGHLAVVQFLVETGRADAHTADLVCTDYVHAKSLHATLT
jgi:ankyrin repeat protein